MGGFGSEGDEGLVLGASAVRQPAVREDQKFLGPNVSYNWN